MRRSLVMSCIAIALQLFLSSALSSAITLEQGKSPVGTDELLYLDAYGQNESQLHFELNVDKIGSNNTELKCDARDSSNQPKPFDSGYIATGADTFIGAFSNLELAIPSRWLLATTCMLLLLFFKRLKWHPHHKQHTAHRYTSMLALIVYTASASNSPFVMANTLPTGVINAPPTIIGANQLAGAGTILNVLDGGLVGPRFAALSGSTVNISGGTVGDDFRAASGSTVSISGGTLLEDFAALSGSHVSVSGGRFGSNFDALRDSTVDISGGVFGSFFQAEGGSNVKLTGGDFQLNGRQVNGTSISLDVDQIFTGRLADGSPFLFSLAAGDELNGVSLERAILPEVNTTPIVVDGTSGVSPNGLNAGQTLTLQSGGVIDSNFAAIRATLNVDGGVIGDSLETYGARVNVSSGTLGKDFRAFSGTILNLSDGIVSSGFRAYAGSNLRISGGKLEGAFNAFPRSTVIIEGGSIGKGFYANAGSLVEFAGGEFELNGNPFTGSTLSLVEGDILAGTLADGSPFLFSRDDGDIIQGVRFRPMSLPPIDATPIVVDASSESIPTGLRAGQMLTLRNGSLDSAFTTIHAYLSIENGVVGAGMETYDSTVAIHDGTIGDNFTAFPRSVVSISGGSVGDSLHAIDSIVHLSGGAVGSDFKASDSTINLSGGRVGEYFRSIGSTVNINGGAVASGFGAFSGSTVNIHNGSVSGGITGGFSVLNLRGGHLGRFVAGGTSTINVSGGTVGDFFDARAKSTINISGGIWGEFFEAFSDSTVNFFGTEFFLDGVPIDLELGLPKVVSHRDARLTGRLVDGNEFAFDLNSLRENSQDFFDPNSTLTLTLVPEPCSSILACILGAAMGCQRNRRGDASGEMELTLAYSAQSHFWGDSGAAENRLSN